MRMLRLRAIDTILVKEAPTGNTAVTTDDCIYIAHTLRQSLPKLLHHFLRAAASVMVTSAVAVRAHTSRFLPRWRRSAGACATGLKTSKRPDWLASMPTEPMP